jgi:aryl-alcohol dehydrogenase-like predicted oxidoreductase
MRYTTIGSDSLSARKVSVLSLGAMRFGATTDEATSFAILDRYVAAGGNFIDTSNNYLFFVYGTQGGESEALLGGWRASRGIGDEVVIATKAGARPIAPAADFDTPRAIRRAARRQRPCGCAASGENPAPAYIPSYFHRCPGATATHNGAAVLGIITRAGAPDSAGAIRQGSRAQPAC